MTVEYTDGNAAASAVSAKPSRDVWQAMMRGLMCRCPACGEGRVFGRYLKVEYACKACGEELHHHRADDAPPYFTVLILGHIIVSVVLAVEIAWTPPLWVHMALWIPLTSALALAMLPPIKGALVGLQWALYMHGFDPDAEDDHAIMAGTATGDT